MSKESEIKQPISLAEQAAIIVSFWSAPEDAQFPQEIIAEVLDSTIGSLAVLRSTGAGPRFLLQGKKVFYRKREVKAWQEQTMIEANNGAQAKEERSRRLTY